MKTFRHSARSAGNRRRGWYFLRRIAAIAFAGSILLVAGTAGAGHDSFRHFQSDQDLSFGVVASGSGAPGSVTVDAATGSVTTTGNVTFFGGTVLPAKFSGQGHGSAQHCIVTLILPLSATLTRGGRRVTLRNFTLSPPFVRLSGQRRFSFNVGATLNLPAGLPAGTYSGNITATAIYIYC
jgi:hypothetical protein